LGSIRPVTESEETIAEFDAGLDNSALWELAALELQEMADTEPKTPTAKASA
jgi:hypothetical protein